MLRSSPNEQTVKFRLARCGEEAHRTYMARESFVQGDSAKVRDGGRGLAVGDEPGQLQHPVLGRGGRKTQHRILFQRNHAVHMRFDALATGGMAELLLHMAGDVGQRLIGQQSTHTVAVRGAGGGLLAVAGASGLVAEVFAESSSASISAGVYAT